MMSRKQSYLYKKPGLTLIEVIISVALLAILSVPIFTMVNTNVKLSQKTELSQQATIVGQKILEYLGSISEIELGNDDILSSLGISLALEKSVDSEEIIGNGETDNNFIVDIEMKNIIQNVEEESPILTANDLMKTPLFLIIEESNQLKINGKLMTDDLSLTIESNIAKICDKNSSCVESTYTNESITIYVKNQILKPYKISVANELDKPKSLYVQYDPNQPKNIKLVSTKGSVDISYLIKKEDFILGSDESLVEQLSDLYEINVLITNPKISGTLFKGNTISQLNISELSQGGY